MIGPKQHYRQLKSDLVKVKRTLSLATALPKFFHERVTLQKAEEEVKRLLDTRVERFLELVRVQIYERPRNPYLRLLKYAGCEFSDFQTQVRHHEIEQSLVKLAGEGVYLTSDEFKGKSEVVRGAESFRVSPRDFERRDLPAGITMQSSGTRNRPIERFTPLELRAVQAAGEAIFYSAHDLFSCVHAVCEPVIAGRMISAIMKAKLGIPTDRWFALKVPVHSLAEEGYHYLNARLVAMMGKWFGPGMASAEYLEPEDVKPIVEWIREKSREGKNCCIKTVVSTAVRIARVALKTGVTLEGATFEIGGEPLTQSKQQVMKRAGADIALRYGPGQASPMYGCGSPDFLDEVHVQQSLVAVVQHPRALDYGGPPVHPLMFTTLHPAAASLLLNVENGDYATLVRRNCGCALERIGFTQHLHTVRSFEKLTSEGMNYLSTDLFGLLEKILPAEFGGGPGDYQLVEEEDKDGQTRLTLLVHPEVGNLSEEKLLSRFQQGLAQGTRNNRFMAKVWQQAGTVRVRREAPHASARGKILPLHINR